MQFISYRRCQYLAAIALIAFAVCAGCGGASTATTSPITSGAGAGTASIKTASANVAPAYLTFSNQVLNSTSSFGTVTLTNSGSENLSISGVGVTGEFAQTNNCGATLAPAAVCTVNVTFNPAALGRRTGTLSITDNAPQSPQVITLSGTGVTAGQLVDSPTAVSFGTVAAGQSSSRVLTVTNTGGQSVTVSSVSTSGAGVSVTGILTPLTLEPNQSSTFSVTFSPASIGSVNGTVYLKNDGLNSSLAIPVTGTGGATLSHLVALSWNASDPTAVGYNAYRATASGGPYSKLTSAAVSQTSYIDDAVQAGKSYFYVVTAVGTDMQESAYSQEAQASVPTP